MTSFALLFPGQGSQYLGMGNSLLADPIGRDLFQTAEEILKVPLKQLMLEGPLLDLTATAIAQPAILLHSVAALSILQRDVDFTISCALGHSLGEYSALVAAKVLNFEDAIEAVHERGKLMQEAVPKGLGAMAAVIGMDAQDIRAALLEFADATKADYAACANFNGPSQTVIAGTKTGVLKAKEKLKSLGAKRIIDLDVSAPFHCALMKPVQKGMLEVLSSIEFSEAVFPVISNVSAQAETKGEVLKKLLLDQIASPVRFTDCVMHIKAKGLLAQGYLEVGPKNTLASIVKKIDSEAVTLNFENLADLTTLKNNMESSE